MNIVFVKYKRGRWDMDREARAYLGWLWIVVRRFYWLLPWLHDLAGIFLEIYLQKWPLKCVTRGVSFLVVFAFFLRVSRVCRYGRR